MPFRRTLILVALVLLPSLARASAQCSEISVYQLCTERDGADMAVGSYCGNAQYNCQTCPGVLDAGTDLSGRYEEFQSSGCQTGGHTVMGSATTCVVLALFIGALLRKRARNGASTNAP